MNDNSMLGRPVRLGLISSGMPASYQDRMRRASAVEIDQHTICEADQAANSALQAVDLQTSDWIGFNALVGDSVLTGERYYQAVRWLLDTGVDTILCTCPLQDQEMHIVGINKRARALGIAVIVADSTEHVGTADWADDAVIVGSEPNLAANEAVWDVDPERCRVGGRLTNASAAGVVAGVALAELERALPRGELMDSLRAWALQIPSRLAS